MDWLKTSGWLAAFGLLLILSAGAMYVFPDDNSQRAAWAVSCFRDGVTGCEERLRYDDMIATWHSRAFWAGGVGVLVLGIAFALGAGADKRANQDAVSEES